jgi:hypothetical protein
MQVINGSDPILHCFSLDLLLSCAVLHNYLRASLWRYDSGRWDYGRELHCYIVKNELDLSFGSDVHLGVV